MLMYCCYSVNNRNKWGAHTLCCTFGFTHRLWRKSQMWRICKLCLLQTFSYALQKSSYVLDSWQPKLSNSPRQYNKYYIGLTCLIKWPVAVIVIVFCTTTNNTINNDEPWDLEHAAVVLPALKRPVIVPFSSRLCGFWRPCLGSGNDYRARRTNQIRQLQRLQRGMSRGERSHSFLSD